MQSALESHRQELGVLWPPVQVTHVLYLHTPAVHGPDLLGCNTGCTGSLWRRTGDIAWLVSYITTFYNGYAALFCTLQMCKRCISRGPGGALPGWGGKYQW